MGNLAQGASPVFVVGRVVALEDPLPLVLHDHRVHIGDLVFLQQLVKMRKAVATPGVGRAG